MRELGPNFDIHAGGVDLVFPHHENEIAQSEAYLGKPEFARIWMHWGSVQLSQKKMSKSEGNVLPAREAIERYSAGAVRLFLLNSSYRSPIDYAESRMAESQTAFKRIETSLSRVFQKLGEVDEGPLDDGLMAQFSGALNADFNTPAAVATLHDAVSLLNEIMAQGIGTGTERPASICRTALIFTSVLGLPIREAQEEHGLLDRLMTKVIQWRQELRKQKHFEMADSIRDDVSEIGILLEDSVEGTTWRRK